MSAAPKPPPALQQRGIKRATDNAGDQRVDVGGAIWRHFGRAMEKHFHEQAVSTARRGAK